MKKPIIEFSNFTFKYREQAKPTLKNIDLTIYQGEKVLIVGPSGSGKSTVSNCINGLIPFLYKGDSTGSLKIHGKETKDLSIFEISKIVGTVLQDPDSQFIGLTVGEDIAFKLENDCVDKESMIDKVNHISKVVGADKYINSSPHRLSGGQKQRVTLAGAMVDDVDVLLFDEPLASLDPATGKKTIELIEAIKQDENKTIIIIEHRLEEVLDGNIDRVIVMKDGEIVGDFTPDKLLESNILKSNGIREPLYITALKYSGYSIESKMNPNDIRNLKVDDNFKKLIQWQKSIDEVTKYKNELIALEFKNIDFRYSNDKKILDDVSFKIYKGEMLSIIGRNGAGKSTLTKLICGFYKPQKGDIFINGSNIKDNSIKELSEKVGIVMQNPNQMISQTMIFDEVAFGLRIRGLDKEIIKEKVYEVLKICGLYKYRNWPISALSFGQKKRVTIASILVLDPKILILDEPTAGQDFKHYTEIMEFLKELNNKGITIIMITHDMHLMLEYTNRAIVLSDGKKIGDGSPAEILTNDNIIKNANLKETSLYTLAIKAGISDCKKFVDSFITYDRGNRKI